MRKPAYIDRLTKLLRADGQPAVYTEPFQLTYPNGVNVYDGQLELTAWRVEQSVVYRTRVDLRSTYKGPDYSEKYHYVFLPYPPHVAQFGQWRAGRREINHLDIPLYVFRLMRLRF